MHRTDHIVEAHEVGAPQDTKKNSAPKGTNETFNCLFWRQLDEWRPPKSHAPDVRKDVIADDKGCGNPKPNESFKNVVHDEMAGKTI